MIKEVEITCAFCDAKGRAKADVPDDVCTIRAVCPNCRKIGKQMQEEGQPVPYDKGIC